MRQARDADFPPQTRLGGGGRQNGRESRLSKGMRRMPQRDLYVLP
jgi:hypothetical protein